MYHYIFRAIKDIVAFSVTPYFLPLLLALLLRWPRFYFDSFKIESLAISGAEFRSKKITFDFSKCSLWKVLINLWKYMTADEGS